jgi:hypothetical protein
VPLAAFPNLHAWCTQSAYAEQMSKVIQIRDVSDAVHDRLAEAARQRGVSLTKYLQQELEELARRAEMLENNRAVLARAAARGRPVPRRAVQDAIDAGRRTR